jgi:antirestriction protein ArdC
MAKAKRPLSDEEREQRRAQQRELVAASIQQLRSSDGWQAYLKTRAQFPTYSWRNVLLILHQHATAERVAGFRAWLDLGYCVVKGSTGIRIWARCEPSNKRLRAWRDAGADPDEQPRAIYKLVSVFAQDQVAPLPPPAQPAPLTAPIREVTGDSHQQLIERLIELACDVGYVVDLCADPGPADGRCNHQTKVIEIADRLAPNGKLATLIHEVGHALVALELGDQHGDTLGYAAEELAVESVAWCCCQTVGLNTSANSIPYLTSWAEHASVDVLEQTAALTDRIATRIETALEVDQPVDVGDPEPLGA